MIKLSNVERNKKKHKLNNSETVFCFNVLLRKLQILKNIAYIGIFDLRGYRNIVILMWIDLLFSSTLGHPI